MPSRLVSILLLLLLLISLAAGTVMIECFSCITPWAGGDFSMFCKDEQFCRGVWCTKGPDERSNGILHGCASVVPLDYFALNSGCKSVNSSRGFYDNCYCKNTAYCNGGRPSAGFSYSTVAACLVFISLAGFPRMF